MGTIFSLSGTEAPSSDHAADCAFPMLTKLEKRVVEGNKNTNLM